MISRDRPQLSPAVHQADEPPCPVALAIQIMALELLDAEDERRVSEPATAANFKIASRFAFYRDDGSFCAWPEGAVITDPDEIAMLVARGAPVERIDT